MPRTSKGNGPAAQAGDFVECAQCQFQIFSSVVFNVEMNGHLHFRLNLFKARDDKTAFSSSSFTRTAQNHVKHKEEVKCPHCEKMFWLCIDFKVTYNNQKYEVKLSITTEKDENQGSKQKGNSSSGTNSLSLRKKVKVFYKCTGETFGADNQVKKKILELNLPLTHVEATSLEDCYVIILFCPITSRVGSDVESCMTEVSTSGKPVILVLMHHTRHPDYSTAGTSWSEVYENVVLDVHLFFHETKPGLLACRQNEEAFRIITNELKKHSWGRLRSIATTGFRASSN